jgi:hypothetical protein
VSNEHRVPDVSPLFSELSSEGIGTRDDEVFVVVTQAYDGFGNQLVRDSGPTFDGFPGVTLWIELPDGRQGKVTLSPIHGDPRKVGFTDVAEGTRCILRGARRSPVLESDGPCACGKGTYHRLYLTRALEKGDTVLICDIWGCYRSRVLASSELLSWIDY